MRQAFVASASLRPMAEQLLQDRTLPAYAGVQAYARAHAKEDAGALAWLVLGYAHVLDKDYAKAIDPLNRAKIHAGDLGDYVGYYLGISYLQTGHTAEALATLADFGKTHPDSLLVRDADVSYADALLIEGQATEAVCAIRKYSQTHTLRPGICARPRLCRVRQQRKSRRDLRQHLLHHAWGYRSGCGLCRVEETAVCPAPKRNSAENAGRRIG